MTQQAHSAPLLSVVIPTHKRPRFLPRAIDSALQAAPDGDVEVIVVPNGPDESWKSVAEHYQQDPRVQWRPVDTAHANVARNHGMEQALGKYLRFLDDDDFLYPDAARQQLLDLMQHGADLSFGEVAMADAEGKITRLAKKLDTDDFIEAALAPEIFTQPSALVYCRNFLKGSFWDININKHQDVYWGWELFRKRELKSLHFRQPVGAWVQHATGARVSQGHHWGKVAKQSASRILELVDTLRSEGRLNEKRANAAANFLWNCVHAGMMFDPIYWIGIARRARDLSIKSHPPTPVYESLWPGRLNPVFLEVAIVPWRWIRVLFGKRYGI